MIHHWQCARQTEASRTSVRIRLRSELNGRVAKHLGMRLELDVHFQTDGDDVWNCRFQILDLKFEDADLREATKIATNSLASSSKGSTRFAGTNFDSIINSSHS